MSIIAFTPGEPAGIGPDLVVIYACKKLCKNLLVFADPDLLRERAHKLGLTIKIKENAPTAKGEICVFPVKAKVNSKCGVLNKNNVQYVLKTIEQAVNYCLNSRVDAICTGPVHKGVINQAGISFSGHTEYLAKLTSTDNTVMMLVTKNLRVALATTHMALKKVAEHIKTDTLNKTIDIVRQSLLDYGINNPKILICGLNPHAGESGFLGDEEINIINPLIKKLNRQNYNLIGSVPADTAFTADSLKGVDAVLAMYHDQGLPVIKALGFKKAVNVTLGLPFIRTSVAHGSALSLAGTGNISLGSFEVALKYTQTLINNAKNM